MMLDQGCGLIVKKSTRGLSTEISNPTDEIRRDEGMAQGLHAEIGAKRMGQEVFNFNA